MWCSGIKQCVENGDDNNDIILLWAKRVLTVTTRTRHCNTYYYVYYNIILFYRLKHCTYCRRYNTYSYYFLFLIDL